MRYFLEKATEEHGLAAYTTLGPASTHYIAIILKLNFKGALNPNFLNLTKNRETFVSRNALV